MRRMLDWDFRNVQAFTPIVIGLGALLAGSATGPIVFEEIAERSGLTFVSASCPSPNKNQPETTVAGVPSLRKESPKYRNRLPQQPRGDLY